MITYNLQLTTAKKRGFTLVEALVFLFIFALITVTFYRVYTVGLQYIINSKNRLAAIALTNEKMEVVRNLSFDDIAHTTGDPVGNLKEEEDVVSSGISFHVFTQIKNVDDPYDGLLGETPNDANYVDYKQVKITVSWGGGKYNVALSSNFVPPGVEQPTVGKGILVVNVTSDKDGGALVPFSTVRIQNSDTGYDETHSTDDQGRLMIVGISQSSEKYKVTVTKSGYESVETLPPYPTSTFDPLHIHASVVADAVNSVNIYQNELSGLIVRSQDYLGTNLPNIDFHLKGGQTLGTTHVVNPGDPVYPVYNIDADYVTDSGGEKNFGSINPGSYEFTLQEANYEIIGMSSSPLTLIPGQNTEWNVKVSPDNVTALLVRVVKSDDGSPLTGASVHLTNGSGYDVTLTTGSDGLSFFPNVAEPPFDPGSYNLEVTIANYQNYSESVTVDSNVLKETTASMVAQ